MCYFTSITADGRTIETRFGIVFPQSELYRPVFSSSSFTCPLMPVITDEEPARVSLLQWGLIPFWVKSEEEAARIKLRALNARSETIFEKPMFRHSIVSKRCLVLVNGFFEWRHIGKKRYPYYIRLKDTEPFALAGIWDRWRDRASDTEVKTFSIVTTEANDLMAQIHNTKRRMPVISPRSSETTWTDGLADRATIESLLKPYDAGDMEAYPVGKDIVKLGFNTTVESILNRVEYADLQPLTQF